MTHVWFQLQLWLRTRAGADAAYSAGVPLSHLKWVCSQGSLQCNRTGAVHKPSSEVGESYRSWGKTLHQWDMGTVDKYFCLLFLGGYFYSVCFLKILAEMNLHCLQQWPLKGTIILAFPPFLIHFPYSFTPASWDQVQNRLLDPSPCLRFCFKRSLK